MKVKSIDHQKVKDNCSYLVSQSAVYEWVINVVRIENHLLHPVVAPALHELAELFEGDPIPENRRMKIWLG